MKAKWKTYYIVASKSRNLFVSDDTKLSNPNGVGGFGIFITCAKHFTSKRKAKKAWLKLGNHKSLFQRVQIQAYESMGHLYP